MKIMSWNINGWGRAKYDNIECVLTVYEPDIAMFCETWFVSSKELPTVRNYTFFVNNRKCLHKNACTGSGGVAILVHDKVLSKYRIEELVLEHDRLMLMVLQNKCSEFRIAVAIGYLPPDNLWYGTEADSFFEILTQLIYTFGECDQVYIAGDFNARIGKKQDFIEDVDKMTQMFSIDKTKNSHGDCFLDFLKDTQYGVINGRVTPIFDNFISFSHFGPSVVDYICTKHECMNYVLECKTLSMNDVWSEVTAEHPNLVPHKMSDHALILITVETSTSRLLSVDSDKEEDVTSEDADSVQPKVAGQPKPVKFKVKGIHEDFMKSQVRVEQLTGLIDELIQLRAAQEEVDRWYGKFVQLYHSEMTTFYKTNWRIPRKVEKTTLWPGKSGGMKNSVALLRLHIKPKRNTLG